MKDTIKIVITLSGRSLKIGYEISSHDVPDVTLEWFKKAVRENVVTQMQNMKAGDFQLLPDGET